ncbi:MAG TPA: bifunctional ornithine acetyltransferase/N-acetylglutamate synthase, partial [Ilumatobacteraceae bacterium]|nr:bifunctional ornithine acetyltransferase/N-acetylglutamate synthase [Ilumatobacteraceae bacterium]
MSATVPTSLPRGFSAYVANIGIKDDTTDFVVVAAATTCPAAGVFTRSRFAGPSVVLSRANIADRTARAVVVISKNANVATGPTGLANAQSVVDGVAAALGADADDVLIASTGVIGRQYPMDRVRAGLDTFSDMARGGELPSDDAWAVAGGIMTTDTVAKVASATVAGARARVVGVAKGVGMIEPDMATLITLVFTDAEVPSAGLDESFRRVVDRTFNCVSVDTDTSTSDTAIILASGAAGPVEPAAFEAALHEVLLSLTKQVARDGEGAETLIEVRVDGARDDAQAKRVAKSIVNSPLVKTAVHGA